MDEQIAGRSYFEVYRTTGREDVHAFLLDAVHRSGATVLYASPADRAPIYIGAQSASGERLGLLIYPFRMTTRITKNRPAGEVRGQLRYGGEESWTRPHPLGRDIAGIDITLILGVELEAGVLIGLDPLIYSNLPMGNSFYARTAQLAEIAEQSWLVWERHNRPSTKRTDTVAPTLLETFVGFAPERLMDFATFERDTSLLGLDPALRFSAANEFGDRPSASPTEATHALEQQFDLSSRVIVDIISKRNRLTVAVRGGVAEYHLEDQLQHDPDVAQVASLDDDGKHDFDVTLASGSFLRVECKNASPNRFKNGDYRVEVQKTRASQNDRASRFYRVDAFDVVAACLFSATKEWTFRFARTTDLERHKEFPDRLAPIQHVGRVWVDSISELES